MRPVGGYDPDEIQTLVEEYAELTELRRRGWILVRLLDLESAIRRLPLPERQAIVLHGLLTLSLRTAGRLAGISGTTVLARYRNGLERLHAILNGGRY